MFVIITAAVLYGGTALAVGIGIGMSLAHTYYVSSKGIVHNEDCKFYRDIPDAKNCEYCGGKKVKR